MSVDFTVKIAGEAGQGLTISGLIFSKTALRSGYFVFNSIEYPSLIRGGHNVFAVRIADEEIHSLKSGVDFLIALNQNAIDLHKQELSGKSGIILNSDSASSASASGIKVFPVPLVKLAESVGGQELMMNNAALGAAIFLLDGDFAILEGAIRNVFSVNKPEVVDLNIKVARAGFNFARNNFSEAGPKFSLKKRNLKGRLLLSGNEAISLGAIAAGCKFFAAYPMTPINSMLNYFAVKAKELDMVYLQPEDEIAGINSAIGASSAGLRSMVATSGGGFSLMVEAFGLAGMAEIPLVIIDGQRPGPSTGLPTWSGQGDLRFVLGASQDDFPRIILAPGDQEECFWQTIEAFNLADIYQTPVVLLVDKFICESQKSCEIFDENKVKIDRGFLLSAKDQQKDYLRYKITENGISLRPVVGRSGQTFILNSDEHDEAGFSDETAENRELMMEKRMRKSGTCAKEIPDPIVYGNSKAKIGLISWGSVKGAILEAQKILKDQNIETRFLHLNHLNPFPVEAVKGFLKQNEKVLMVEQNISGQAAGLICEKTGIKIENLLLKYDGRPVYPEEVVQKIKSKKEK